MKKIYIVLLIVVLTLLDQLIKWIIELKFIETHFEIIPNIFEFRPKYNMNYFYLNDALNIGIGLWFSLALMIFFIIVFLIICKVFRHFSLHKKLLDISVVFILSAFLCAFVSNIFWKGVLDYIYLKPWFIFDLKDIYVWTGIILFLTANAKDYKSGVRIGWKDMIRFYKRK